MCPLAFHFLDPEKPDWDAVRSGHEGARCLVCLQVVRRLPSTEVGPERDGARLHHLLDGRARIDAERLSVNQAEHNPLVVHDDAHVPGALAHAVVHGVNSLVDPARRNVPPGDIGDARGVSLLALPRQPRGEPVRLARLIAIYLPEPECLEPRRGSRAHISLVVVAVDNHGPLGVELPRRLATEGLQWDVDCGWDVFGRVLFGGKHLDQLRPRSQTLLDPVSIDLRRRHRLSFGPHTERSPPDGTSARGEYELGTSESAAVLF